MPPVSRKELSEEGSRAGVGCVIGIILGAVIGWLVITIYNHDQCSTVAAAFQGCRVIKPVVGALGGILIGAIVGGLLGAQFRARG